MNRIIHRVAAVISSHLNLTPSQLYPSPSKFYLLRRMIVFATRCKGLGVGVDIACADFKYRSILKTENYIGIDVCEEIVRKGMALRGKHGDIGMVRDLLSLEGFSSCADMVVSTHTLAHLDPDEREKGVKILVNMVSRNGALFFNLPKESDTQELRNHIESEFGDVKRYEYGKRVFIKIESYFSNRTNGKNVASAIMLGIIILISYALSFFEQGRDNDGYYVLYECLNKKAVSDDHGLSKYKNCGFVKMSG